MSSPPAKRRRLSPSGSLDNDLKASAKRLMSTWDAIEAKYCHSGPQARDENEDDLVDITTGQVVVDRGIVRSMKPARALGNIGDSDDEETPVEVEGEEEDELMHQVLERERARWSRLVGNDTDEEPDELDLLPPRTPHTVIDLTLPSPEPGQSTCSPSPPPVTPSPTKKRAMSKPFVLLTRRSASVIPAEVVEEEKEGDSDDELLLLPSPTKPSPSPVKSRASILMPPPKNPLPTPSPSRTPSMPPFFHSGTKRKRTLESTFYDTVVPIPDEEEDEFDFLPPSRGRSRSRARSISRSSSSPTKSASTRYLPQHEIPSNTPLPSFPRTNSFPSPVSIASSSTVLSSSPPPPLPSASSLRIRSRSRERNGRFGPFPFLRRAPSPPALLSMSRKGKERAYDYDGPLSETSSLNKASLNNLPVNVPSGPSIENDSPSPPPRASSIRKGKERTHDLEPTHDAFDWSFGLDRPSSHRIPSPQLPPPLPRRTTISSLHHSHSRPLYRQRSGSPPLPLRRSSAPSSPVLKSALKGVSSLVSSDTFADSFHRPRKRSQSRSAPAKRRSRSLSRPRVGLAADTKQTLQLLQELVNGLLQSQNPRNEESTDDNDDDDDEAEDEYDIPPPPPRFRGRRVSFKSLSPLSDEDDTRSHGKQAKEDEDQHQRRYRASTPGPSLLRQRGRNAEDSE